MVDKKEAYRVAFKNSNYRASLVTDLDGTKEKYGHPQ
jgi:hypothetical protein